VIGLAMITIAACSNESGLLRLTAPSVSGIVPNAAQHGSAQYATIFDFNGYNGDSPAGNLVQYAGDLYGTTVAGGTSSEGVVFKVTVSGTETVLHNFGSYGDGAEPKAGLTIVRGVLYGTTYSGGVYGKGTVFSVTTEGKERVLYSFGSQPGDGVNPLAALTPLDGEMYGTTPSGGAGNAGTVFLITRAGKEKTIYYFPSYSKKFGEEPFAGLLAYGGKLYGTTEAEGPCGQGTVFSVTTGGKAATIYGFPCKRNDGSFPEAGVTIVNGVLYGTTTWGGKAFYPYGTVFSLTLSGHEKELFNFIPDTEYGDGPNTALTYLKGVLYGTTPEGAANDEGAVYGVTPSGQATLLHTFAGSSDGAMPLAGLINVHSTLFGTTSAGGSSNDGTVYRLTP
jgi:uncharacterized repeat protein (TIGR03803 family)